MNARSVPEIAEAMSLFESYEKSRHDYRAAKKFTDAVQTLNEYIEREPNTPHRDFINNLKLANTRSLLRNLTKVNLKDVHAWGEHILLILVTVKAEAEALTATYPELEKDFDAFLAVWKEELARALIEDQEREQQEAHRRPAT